MSQPGWELIRVERQRQINVEGFDEKHDEGHTADLINAARCYTEEARFDTWNPGIRSNPERISMPSEWPWESEYWKPTTNPIRDLVKAGALIAAAIDALLSEKGPEL